MLSHEIQISNCNVRVLTVAFASSPFKLVLETSYLYSQELHLYFFMGFSLFTHTSANDYIISDNGALI